MSWIWTKLAAITLIVLPIAITVLMFTFDYGTHMLLELAGIMALGSIFMVIAIICVWVGMMILKM